MVYNVLYKTSKAVPISMYMILLLTILCLLSGSWYAYRISFFSPRKHRAVPNAPMEGEQYDAVAEDISRISGIMQRIPFEEVRIKSFDGTELYGRYYHQSDGAPVELLFHGYRSHPYRDCSGGHALSRKMGFNALVVDQRAHGQSGGHTICFGIKERKDCLCWVHYLNGRFGSEVPIILSGLSMGAATVLMSSGLELPHNVSCIIADSPYSSPAAIIEKVCRDKRYPVFLCRPFVQLGALIYGGFRLGSCTAKEAVRNSKIPILLIHGEDDRFVPCEMSLEIASVCASRVEVATFPDAGHGLCYMIDPVRYEAVVCHFLQSIPSVKNAINPGYIDELEKNING